MIRILGALCSRSISNRVRRVGQPKYDDARKAKQILQVGALRNVSDRLDELCLRSLDRAMWCEVLWGPERKLRLDWSKNGSPLRSAHGQQWSRNGDNGIRFETAYEEYYARRFPLKRRVRRALYADGIDKPTVSVLTERALLSRGRGAALSLCDIGQSPRPPHI